MPSLSPPDPGVQSSGVPKRRLGVALLVPPPLAAEVDGLRRAMGDPSLGRIPAHLTLVPPVNVRDDRLPDALARLRDAAAATRPFRLTLGPPATFLPVNPVLYLGVGGDLDALRALRDRVFREPLARTLTWPFVPHVTVADEAEPARIHAALDALCDFTVEVDVERVHLLEEGPGRAWTVRADAVFAPPAIVGRGGLPVELTTSERADPEVAAFARREWPDEPEADVVVTARRDGRILGVAEGSVRAADGTAHLALLLVAETERGTGVGSHLLAAFCDEAIRGGAHASTVRTRRGGRAEQFYRDRGWTPEARLPAHRGGEDFVQLRRQFL
jgi:2'-5' RNA ligase/N-acetylglutamate synthase-like GNAT family acetyltransferase